MRLLITNDDGIDAPGIQTLTRAVARWITEGENRSAVVVAPNRNFSGMSSAVGDVFAHPDVPFERRVIDGAESIEAFALDAAPALCAIMGAIGYFGTQPTFVLSGINAGANVGRSVLHSGTVGAVLTGGQLGLPGLAVSVQWGENVHYDTAAEVAVDVLTEIEGHDGNFLLNLNVPNLTAAELKGVKRARVSTAGLVKPVSPTEPLGDAGVVTLRLGQASPELNDVSDEELDDDGALVAAGYAALSALRGITEETEARSDLVLRKALSAIERHLDDAR
jgi:5'-nucleotidase